MSRLLISQAEELMFLSFFCCKNSIYKQNCASLNEKYVKIIRVCEKISLQFTSKELEYGISLCYIFSIPIDLLQIYW